MSLWPTIFKASGTMGSIGSPLGTTPDNNNNNKK